MAKVSELREGDVFDVLELPVDIDLDEWPLAEYEFAVVSAVETDWAPGSTKLIVHTENHGSWAVEPGVEVGVRGRVGQ